VLVEQRRTVSVVIPAYNEAAIIESTIDRVCDVMDRLSDRWAFSMIVVDDGSTDGTGDIADRVAAGRTDVTVLHHPVNFKLGQALRYAFGVTTADFVVTLDADLSYSPEHIEPMLDAIVTTHAKVVVASPYAPGGEVGGVPGRRLLASRMANRFLSITAKGDLSTITGMARAYDGVFLRSLNLKAMDIEINAEIIYKAQLLRARIVEVPASLQWDPSRTSSFRMSRSVAAYAFSGFLFRPFAFFIVPGLVALGIGLLLWIVAFISWWTDEGGVLAAIVAGSATLVGVQLLALGLLSVQNKRYFEELFHLGTSVYRFTRR
jgi:glycosyltransferase involved in cell wall biosynthesis